MQLQTNRPALSRYWILPFRLGVVLTVLCSLLSGGVTHAEAPRLKGLIPHHAEESAMADGDRLGIGSARLIGPERVEVYTYHTWRFVFEAGPAGISPGGGLRVGMRHLACWTMPQTDHPQADGYLTATASGGQTLQIRCQPRELMNACFAWQQLVEIILPEQRLEPGQTLEIVYGDRSRGSSGIRVQPFDESCFVFKTNVDVQGEGRFLPVRNSPAIEIVSGPACRLTVVTPSDAVAGQATWCLVRAEDRFGNPATSYRGTIHAVPDPSVTGLPEAYTFTEQDQGVHRFEKAVFTQDGRHTFRFRGDLDEVSSNPVRVQTERAPRLLLWGDLHGHTLMSDGRGTVEEYYDFARHVAGLDICAVTDHAFEVMDEMWEHSKRVTHQAYEPGSFVTFPAYEWSGITPLGGDHNCYFLDNDPPIFRSTLMYDPTNLQNYHGPDPKREHVTDIFAELRQRLRDRNVLCIPHFGGRPGNPQWHDESVQRMIEIFSEHQRSETWARTFLDKGYRLGIIASSDGHFGNPGYGYLKPGEDWDHQEIGMGLVAVYAEQRTRESVFHALYERRVYATSGDRIVLDFQVNGQPMGSEIHANEAPELTVEVIGTTDIARIEIQKNGQAAHVIEPQEQRVSLTWVDPSFESGQSASYHVHVWQTNGEEAICSPVWVN